jgi:hypothetical protein
VHDATLAALGATRFFGFVADLCARCNCFQMLMLGGHSHEQLAMKGCGKGAHAPWRRVLLLAPVGRTRDGVSLLSEPYPASASHCVGVSPDGCSMVVIIGINCGLSLVSVHLEPPTTVDCGAS